MSYIIVKNGAFSSRVDYTGNIAWDDTHCCPAHMLTPEEAEYFGVVPLTLTSPPSYNPVTHNRRELAPILVQNEWSQDWTQQWEVYPLPAGEVAANIANAKLDKWLQIKAERDRRKSGGVLVSGKWYHSDVDSRIQQLGLVMMGASVPSVQWKTMDGSFVTMSQTIANGIFQGAANLDMTLFSVAEAHRLAMEASADPAAYDFSAGWPAQFV